jgi:hypothetical protein
MKATETAPSDLVDRLLDAATRRDAAARNSHNPRIAADLEAAAHAYRKLAETVRNSRRFHEATMKNPAPAI